MSAARKSCKVQSNFENIMNKNRIAVVSLFLSSLLPLQGFALPTQESTHPIPLNTADLQTLTKSVKGIGIKRAEAIIKYREEHGKFTSVEQLQAVPGIGEKFVFSHKEELLKTFSLN